VLLILDQSKFVVIIYYRICIV